MRPRFDFSRPEYFRMGAYKRDNDGDKFQTYGQEFNVTSVIVHSQYDPTDMSHDVALVELDQQATLGR